MPETETSDHQLSNDTPTNQSNPLLFLGACGVFMLIGLMILVWLGTDRNRTAIGKDLPKFALDPLVNTDQSLSTDQITTKQSILYLWSPDSDDAHEDLKRMQEIAQKHPDYALVSISFSEGAVVFELLRDRSREQLEKAELNWPTYVDNNGSAGMQFAMLMPFGSFGFPTIFVTNPSGRISYYCEARNAENWKELNRHLTK